MPPASEPEPLVDRPRPVVRGRRRWLAAVAVLAGLPLLLGKTFELATPAPFDSAAYVYSAQRVLEGARIGVDEQPTALPGTLLVNLLGVWMAGYGDTGPKLVQAGFQVVALLLMLVVLERWFGPLAAGTSVVLASLYLSAPVIAKYGNVKEQYMIACAVTGVACLMLRQGGGSGWLTAAGGAALSWAPLFKPSGFSAGFAAVLFLLVRFGEGHRGAGENGKDVLLFSAGGVLGLVPVLVWLALVGAPPSCWPYASVLGPPLAGGGKVGLYLSEGRKLMPLTQLAPIVLRYYLVLALPIALAVTALVIAVVRQVKPRRPQETTSAPVVLLLGVWWLLDMAFVWVSPRSYEEYYLPLTASGAMLGALALQAWDERVLTAGRSRRSRLAVATGLVGMLILAHPIVIGLRRSPFWGKRYPERQRGYVQSLEGVLTRWREGRLPDWEAVSEKVRRSTLPTDRIYVWGWYPGIYVRARRTSPSPRACEGSLHALPPAQVAARVAEILAAFAATPPTVIVDTRKREFPWDRPPLELWPRGDDGSLLPPSPELVSAHDAAYARRLAAAHGEDEARRYLALAPLRAYVMQGYEVAGELGDFVVFRRRPASAAAPSPRSPGADRG